MQLHITGHHVDLTDGLKDKVKVSMEKLEKHFDHITHIYVTLNVEKKSHKAEAKLALTNSSDYIFAEAIEDDMYRSIDSLYHKLDRQVIKHKEKIQDHHKKDLL